MGTRPHATWLLSLSVLLVAGCAISPEAENRRAAIEADITDILSLPVTEELGGPQRCLRDNDYRSFRPLGDRHILFTGRRGKQWINELRTRCTDLRYGHVMMVRAFSPSRVCDTDRFQMSDWFYSPWYRRWPPWQWGPGWGTGVYCVFGKFHPVTDGQVAEIEAVLERR